MMSTRSDQMSEQSKITTQEGSPSVQAVRMSVITGGDELEVTLPPVGISLPISGRGDARWHRHLLLSAGRWCAFFIAMTSSTARALPSSACEAETAAHAAQVRACVTGQSAFPV